MSPLWLLLGLLALTGSSESSNWGCYGNIRTMNTPGASCGIGRRYGLTYCGVRASERLAEIDRPYLLKVQPTIRVTGKKYCVDPAVIAGLLSRESQGGNLVVGMGNVGNGVGVIQSNDISVKGVTYCIQEGSGSPSSVLVTCMPAAQAGPLPGSFGVRFAALGKGITLDSTCVNVLAPGLTSLCYTEGPNVYPPTSWKSESWVSQKTETLTSIIKQVRERFPTWTPDQYLRGGLCAYSKGPSFIRSDQDLSCDFCNDVLARAKYFKNHGF